MTHLHHTAADQISWCLLHAQHEARHRVVTTATFVILFT